MQIADEPQNLTPERIARALSRLRDRRIGVAEMTPGGVQIENADYGVRSYSATSLVELLNCSATRGVWRIGAELVDEREGTTRPQTIVYKELQDRGQGPERWKADVGREQPYYWAREALVGPLLRHLNGPLRVPKAVPENLGRGVRGVWFEDIGDAWPAAKWSPPRHILAAHHLGRMQGEFASSPRRRQQLCSSKGLARDWLHEYLRRVEPEVNASFANSKLWAKPAIKDALGRNALTDAQDLWSMRHQLNAMLSKLPQTLCHQDFWPGQLFSATDQHGFEDTVVIDWAFAGIEALGTDAANLVVDSATDGLLIVDDIKEMWDVVRSVHTQGLRAGGWRGDERLVELGMTAGAAAKWSWFTPAMVAWSKDDESWGEWQDRWGETPEAAFQTRAEVLNFVRGLAERAFTLADELRLTNQLDPLRRAGSLPAIALS